MKLVTKHKLENNQLYYYEIQRYGKTYHKGKGIYVSDFHYYKNNQQTRLNNNIFCFIEPHSLNKSEWQKNPRFERMYHHHTNRIQILYSSKGHYYKKIIHAYEIYGHM